MSNDPNNESQTPAPEVLTVGGESSTPDTSNGQQAEVVKTAPATPKRRIAYKPSHKGTFIGLVVVILILAINAGIIAFVMRNQVTAEEERIKNGVTISSATLDKLGVSRNPAGNAETELIVGPKSTFKDNVQMAGSLQVGGSLVLNSKFTASDAALAKLQAGDTQVQSLNVNGDGTISTLNLRKDLKVAGGDATPGTVDSQPTNDR
jgi:cytoskeletal protein CcmA (bactofilin family)